AAIVSVADTSDVVAAVEFARDHGLRIAIRGGGHSYCGAPLRDDALLIDLGHLSEIVVDASGRTAAVQPNVSGRVFQASLERFGLAFPFGHCSTVPVSGFVLNGGLGWNSAVWGHACRNLIGVDVVTAAGESIRVDEAHEPDLFWAARGAGP